MTRCAIYTRVSTDRQEEEGSSLATQEERARAYCAEHGYDIIGVWREAHSGAELWERPQLTLLRREVTAKRLDVVLGYAVDRISRDQIHLAVLVDECQRHACRLEFVTEAFDDSAIGRFILSARSFAAELEREKIRERTIRAKLARVQSGKIHNWGRELYGYRRDKAAGVRTVYEPEAAVVRMIFDWVTNEGLSTYGVMRRLNEREVPPPTAAHWGHVTVRYILRQEAYTGKTVAWSVQRGKHGTRTRDRSEWIEMPDGVTPAIISASQWHRAQQAVSGRQQRSANRRNETRPYLLRGLISCAVCGRTMQPMWNRSLRVYRCCSRQTYAGACGGKPARADDTEAAVWERVTSLLAEPQQVAAEIAASGENGPQSHQVEAEAAGRQLERLSRQQDRLLRLYGDGGGTMPYERIERELERLEREKRDISTALARAEAERQEVAMDAERLAALAAFCAALPANAGFEERRSLLEQLGVRVRASGTVCEVSFG